MLLEINKKQSMKFNIGLHQKNYILTKQFMILFTMIVQVIIILVLFGKRYDLTDFQTPLSFGKFKYFTGANNLYSKAGLISAIKEIGILPSDTLLIHSSMKAIGEVEHGAETVITAFTEYLTDEAKEHLAKLYGYKEYLPKPAPALTKG